MRMGETLTTGAGIGGDSPSSSAGWGDLRVVAIYCGGGSELSRKHQNRMFGQEEAPPWSSVPREGGADMR